MIYIGKPYIEAREEQSRLCARVCINGQENTAWFSVEPEYGQYLTDDRADAFVVGFLTTALRLGADIHCDAPITKRLFYQLQHYLIPSLSGNMEIYHSITIHAPVTDQVLPCEGAVGTGWTGGVDCSFTLMNHLCSEQPHYRLTHLLIANNGALESKDPQRRLRQMVERARVGAGSEFGLSVIGVDTNLHILQNELYLSVAAFRLPAVVLALQKLFRVFLHSSGTTFARFSLNQGDSSDYELLPLSLLETDCTVFYSTGGKYSRVEKLDALSGFPFAYKNLHPCVRGSENNCSTCQKCTRTMAALDVLGTLERFRPVFDVDLYYEKKDQILEDILIHSGHMFPTDILEEMRQRGIGVPAHVARKVRLRRAATIVTQRKLKSKEE